VDRVTYREFPAPAPLRGLAECGWSNALATGGVEVVLPDGCMDLVWTGAELVVAGPDTEPHPYRPPNGMPAAGLRFAPGRLPALLGVPAAAVRDERAPLAELLPDLARRTTARLEAGAPPAAALLELAVALPGAPPAAGISAAVLLIRRGRSVADTADALGWTTRSLHRHCLDWFGYGPAVLRRILRFRRASDLLRAGVGTAEVAARTGYADQPHLSREVRALAGVAPGQLSPGRSGPGRSGPGRSGSAQVGSGA
jgi:AraC-like DNA-binding protein